MGDEVLEIGMIGAVAVAPDHRSGRMTTCGRG
jgi:hypothetical protein